MVWKRIAGSNKANNLFFFILGSPVGNIIAIPVTGLLSKYGFDGGWPSVFYFFGESDGNCLTDIFLWNKVFVIHDKIRHFCLTKLLFTLKCIFLPQQTIKWPEIKAKKLLISIFYDKHRHIVLSRVEVNVSFV